MARVVAVANQKGGVAKTTTVQALGVALAGGGRRVLMVDLDPQACLTFSLGFDPDGLARSLHDVFVRRAELSEVILPVPGVAGLDRFTLLVEYLQVEARHWHCRRAVLDGKGAKAAALNPESASCRKKWPSCCSTRQYIDCARPSRFHAPVSCSKSCIP